MSAVYYVSVQPAAPTYAVLGKKYSCVAIPLRRTAIFLITSKAKIPEYKNREGLCFALVVGLVGFMFVWLVWVLVFLFVLKSAQGNLKIPAVS